MIDLDYSRQRMLEDLGLSSELEERRGTTQDLDCLQAERARILLRVHRPDDVLEPLTDVLARRFAGIPREELARSIDSPVKKALGNAHKRGNGGDSRKWIEVEAIVTEHGAFVRISDEGEGFDVASTLEKFRAGETYFVHSGSGFRRYTKARSVITFADGGSTLLLRYAPANAGRGPAVTR